MSKKWKKKQENIQTWKEAALSHLGVSSEDDIRGWYERFGKDDYRLDGSEKFIDIVTGFKNKPIRIFGDKDPDGVMASRIMETGLETYGCKDVKVRLPYSKSEGFGLNVNAIDEFPEGCLLITVDNGVSALEPVRYAKQRGCTVIVTDHHDPEVDENKNIILPEADLVIDPEAVPDSADYPHYCGAGVAFKLARKLLASAGIVNGNILNQLLSYAAIATVADVVELREENFVFVSYGLACINKGITSAGVMAMAELGNLCGHVTAKNIAFDIAPMINACHRMKDDGADVVFRLICEDNALRAKIGAQDVQNIRAACKEYSSSGTEDVLAYIRDNKMQDDPVLVVQTNAAEGVRGIIAARVVEEFGVPTLIVGPSEMEPKLLKGSGRSVDGVDLTTLLRESGAVFESLGGHPQACGCSMMKERFDENRKLVMDKAKEMDIHKVDQTVSYYDVEIPDSEIRPAVEGLKAFEPTGKGNEPVVFKVDYHPSSIRFIGKDKQTVKLTCRDGSDAIAYHMADRFREAGYGEGFENNMPDSIILYGTVQENIWKPKNGMERRTPQVFFEDFEIK